jgi:hypothetical protein
MRPPNKTSQAKMTKAEAEPVPDAPTPDVSDATVGTETAQRMAARYLPNCVRLFRRGQQIEYNN